MLKKLFFVAGLAACSSAVFSAEKNLYAALDAGVAQYKNAGDFDDPGVVKISLGYKFDKNWAAEIGYTVFGDSTVEYTEYYNYRYYTVPVTLKANSVTGAVIGTLPVEGKFDVFAKVGIASNHAKVEATYAGNSASESYSKTSALLGIGAQYHFTKDFTVRAQYEDYGKFRSDVNDPLKASTVTIGLLVRF